ncbi:amino acid adenylation domain-containing protein [Actinosynnema sp. NPDC050801]|uniref:amino acid adenylation domain-containing protein n=1 Tax=unclassified Actinosynnema TaxID=2637065 RepID=UPI0033C70233
MLPLSVAQHGLWLAQQFVDDKAVYNVPYAVRLRGVVDVVALEGAVGEMVARHEVLRSRIVVVGGEPVQVPVVGVSVPVRVVDVSGGSGVEGRARVVVEEEALRPFDLGVVPLVRVVLVRLSLVDHVLVVVMHHVVSDGWSRGVVVGELGELYSAAVSGRVAVLPPLPVQYADFALWQRKKLTSAAAGDLVAYWNERLAGAPTVLELPADRSRPVRPSFAAGVAELSVPPAVVSRLRDIGQARGATPFMTALAAFQLLLARWTGVDDLVVGVPVAGRERPELERLVGYFLTTVPVRVRLPRQATFAEFLDLVRGHVLDDLAHQDLPFDRIVAEVVPQREADRNPLVQVVFQLIAGQGPQLRLAGLEASSFGLKAVTTRFDLECRLVERDGGLVGELTYRRDMLDPTRMDRLARQYERMLADIAADPGRPLEEYRPVDPAEVDLLVRDWGRTEGRYPARPVHRLVEERVAAEPDAVALVAGDGTLTRGELNRRANRLARHLSRRGVRPGELVAVRLGKGSDLVVAVLAVLKTGAAYLPLDVALPDERTSALLGLAAVRLVVVAERENAAAPWLGDRDVVVVDEPSIAAEPDGDLDVEVSPEDLACVMFTSGTTGVPKPVAAPHRAVVRTFFGQDFARFGPDEVSLQLAPVSWDAFVLELWPALLHGGRCVLADDGPSPDQVVELVRRHGVTTLWLSAGLFNVFADEHVELFGLLRQVMTGGDVVSPAHVQRVGRDFPGLRVVNGYGPVETMVFATAHQVRVEEGMPARVPVGRPIAGAAVHVLDPRLEVAPIGLVGEVYVGGDGLAHGYLGQSGATAGRFVPDPFGAPGRRLYRTGDLARWTDAGVLEFVGRTDDQAKVGGFRVEPDEVRVALAGAPGVRDAVVVIREDLPGDKRLVGYAVGEPAPDPRLLRDHLVGRLPAHLVPSAFVVLDRLPLTPAGKLDRRALPAPGGDRPDWLEEYRPPRTDVERTIARMWVDLLGLDRVGRDDDFFRLGGHSLLAVKLVARVRAELGVDLSAKAVYEAPTVARIASEVVGRRTSGTAGPLEPVPRDRPLPLSFAQQRLWFFDRLLPGSPVYNVPYAVRLRGVVDVVALEGAVGEMVARHEVLRSRIVVVGGEPVQVPVVGVSVPVRVVDVSGGSGVEGRARVVVEEEALRPFDLGVVPLVRVVLVRLSLVDHVLVVVMHHVVSDGWSRGVVVGELGELYSAAVSGRVAVLPPLPVQYADFALWQRTWMTGDVLRAELDHWRAALAGAPTVLELPADRPRPQRPSYSGGLAELRVPPELTDRLRTLGRERGASLFMTLLAGFQYLLSRWAGVDDVMVGVPVAGRVRPELERLVGFFVNTLAVRADCSGPLSFTDLLGRVRRSTLAAYAHQDLPFDELVAELSPVREGNRNPLVQVEFQLLEAGGRQWRLTGLEASSYGSRTPTTRFDLECDLIERDGGLTGGITFSRDLFDQDRVDAWAREYERFLAAVAVDPDRPLSDLVAVAGARGIAARAEPIPPAGPVRFVEPATAAQRVLAEVWREVLGVEKIGVHDNFFDVGGRSLLAIKMVTRVRQRLGVEIPLEVFFDRPTIAELAAEVTDREPRDGVVDLVAGLSDEDVSRMLRELGEDDDHTLG